MEESIDTIKSRIKFFQEILLLNVQKIQKYHYDFEESVKEILCANKEKNFDPWKFKRALFEMESNLSHASLIANEIDKKINEINCKRLSDV